ncbi:MAG: hypothetical protein AAFP90_04280 [Planctomycetota bacterium]
MTPIDPDCSWQDAIFSSPGSAFDVTMPLPSALPGADLLGSFDILGPLLLPILAIGSLMMHRLGDADDPAEKDSAFGNGQRTFIALLMIMILVTIRAVIVQSDMWLLCTGTLAITIFAALYSPSTRGEEEWEPNR